MNVFQNEYLYMVAIHRQASIYNRCRHFDLAVAIPISLRLRFEAIAVSWKGIDIRGISIMMQLHVAEARPKEMYNGI
jgi:hypothetical protein